MQMRILEEKFSIEFVVLLVKGPSRYKYPDRHKMIALEIRYSLPKEFKCENKSKIVVLTMSIAKII